MDSKQEFPTPIFAAMFIVLISGLAIGLAAEGLSDSQENKVLNAVPQEADFIIGVDMNGLLKDETTEDIGSELAESSGQEYEDIVMDARGSFFRDSVGDASQLTSDVTYSKYGNVYVFVKNIEASPDGDLSSPEYGGIVINAPQVSGELFQSFVDNNEFEKLDEYKGVQLYKSETYDYKVAARSGNGLLLFGTGKEPVEDSLDSLYRDIPSEYDQVKLTENTYITGLFTNLGTAGYATPVDTEIDTLWIEYSTDGVNEILLDAEVTTVEQQQAESLIDRVNRRSENVNQFVGKNIVTAERDGRTVSITANPNSDTLSDSLATIFFSITNRGI